MHFEVPASARLAGVDRFLRETWLECCGHLSAFTIRGKEYLSDLGDDDYDDQDVEDMSALFGAVLKPGNKFRHLYDFGTATELSLKVVSCREASGQSRRVKLLARNEPPSMLCEVCGNAAVCVCPQCLEGAAGWFCDQCAGGHQCATEIDLLPVVNSPRVGMCGYTGEIETE
ncbi:MAG: IS1096 element passenger TnpR family protein [bacterium]